MVGRQPRARYVLPKREIRDPRALRALAHPLRLQILDLLHRFGPATATTMARRLRQNTGATSYHLRQLAQYGFVTADRERGRGRERWWRPVHADFRLGVGLPSGAGRIAGDELRFSQLTRDGQVLAAYLREHVRYPEWDEAALFSSSVAHLTRRELSAFGEDVVRIIKRYYRPEGKRPPEAQPVKLMLYGFLWPSSDRHG
jgi:DNA-binding transcriptional ArsR family regulator